MLRTVLELLTGASTRQDSDTADRHARQIELGKHFQDEASNRKSELLSVATLQLGMLGATTAFGAKEALDAFFPEATANGAADEKGAVILLIVGAVGLCLATLACITTLHLSGHVVRSRWNCIPDNFIWFGVCCRTHRRSGSSGE
jgi:alkylhydroperoxidase/carboxymuconolactone decarboxylase family protein YurZ